MSRISDKQIQSGIKAEMKWEKAKEKGIEVTPYKLNEEKIKPRFLVPVMVTCANYLARQ